MTIRRSTSGVLFGFAAAGALVLALCAASPVAASPSPVPGEGGAARTRPQSKPVNIGSSAGSHQAQPRTQLLRPLVVGQPRRPPQ